MNGKDNTTIVEAVELGVHFTGMSGMFDDRRAQRLRGSSRLLRGADDGAFDRTFWGSITPEARLALMWDMVLEARALKGLPDGEPRLQRSVCRVQRGRR